jgi:hypothetical protein
VKPRCTAEAGEAAAVAFEQASPHRAEAGALKSNRRLDHRRNLGADRLCGKTFTKFQIGNQQNQAFASIHI